MSNIKYCIRIGILFLAGIIVFGCNEDRQNEKDSDIFQINIPLTSGDKPLFADSLFCGKEIVPLETTPECLISQIDKLEIADDGDGFPAELLKNGMTNRILYSFSVDKENLIMEKYRKNNSKPLKVLFYL